MDWIALETDPLWKGLWASREVKEKKAKVLALLLAGKWDIETLGFLRGQLRALDELEQLVKSLAEKQLADDKKARSETQVEPRVSRFRSLINRAPAIR